MRVTLGRPDDRFARPAGRARRAARRRRRASPATRMVLRHRHGPADDARHAGRRVRLRERRPVGVGRRRARSSRPTPDLALRLRAPAVLAALDATRVKRTRRLDGPPRPTASPPPTARPSTALRPVASAPLTRALSDAALAYDSLAQAAPATGDEAARAAAARRRSRRRRRAAGRGERRRLRRPRPLAGAARDDVVAADRALDARRRRARPRAGAPAVQRPPAALSPRPRPVGVSLPTLLVLAVALLVSALAPAGGAPSPAAPERRAAATGDEPPRPSRRRASRASCGAPADADRAAADLRALERAAARAGRRRREGRRPRLRYGVVVDSVNVSVLE